MAPRHIRHLAGMAATLAAFWFTVDDALACACCSNRASRYVATEKLDQPRLVQIEQMAFAEEAFVAETAADPIIDRKDFGTTLKLAVTRSATEMVFSFRDESGRRAALTLAIPGTISIFQVDPRGDSKDEGLGPVLYKEWQLTADARGAGVLQSLAGAGQKLTLILHGRGRGCTEAGDFTDWTLLLQGPAGNLALYGALTSAFR